MDAVHTEMVKLTDLPNIGKSLAADLKLLGITKPRQLAGKDPYKMYSKLASMTGGYQDPCVLDTFIAAVRFMEGGPATPWWEFTAERKRELEKRGL
jgi:hypothetical protein